MPADGADKPGRGPDPGSDPDSQLVLGLLEAYSVGVFPMADPRTGVVSWYDPDPRAVLPLTPSRDRQGEQDATGFRVSRSLAKRVRSGRFRVTSDRAFTAVMRGCAAPRAGQSGEESWIDDQIIAAYSALHAAGYAHSVEVWRDDLDDEPRLVGGPRRVGGSYGVTLGGLFAGESMFSRPDAGGRDASKVALVRCWRHLRERGYALFDVQFWNPHLEQFGCEEIRRAEYHARLREAVTMDVTWGEVTWGELEDEGESA